MKIKKTLKRVDIYVILLIIIAVFTHWQWFKPNNILFSWDWWYWPKEAMQSLYPIGLGTYINFFNFGMQNIQISFNSFFSLWGLIGDYMIATKLTFMIPIAILSVLSPYFLVKYLVKNRKIAFVSSLFYSFSTILLFFELSHLTIAFVFSLAPFILLSFVVLMRKFNAINLLIFALLYTLGICYEFRIMLIVTFALLVYFVLYSNKKSFLKNKFKHLWLLILIVLLNSFWLLPTLIIDKTLISETANRGLFGDQLFNLFYSFTSFKHAWSGSEMFSSFDLNPIPVLFWIVPLFAFGIYLYFKKIKSRNEKKLIIFFGILSLFGILLTKQSVEPFSGLYAWLYNNFPGFNLFREASKFFILVLLGYVGLLAFSLKYLIVENKKVNKYFKGFILIGLSLLFLWNTKPLITCEVGGLFSERIRPAEYEKLDNFLKNQDNIFRTLWIPRDVQWGYFDSKKPRVSAVAVEGNEYGDYYEKNINKNNYAKFIFEPFEQNFGNYLADISNIKYFIIPMPDDQDDAFYYYGSKYQDYVDKIKNVEFLEEIKLDGLDKIKVYENKNYKPHIFSINNIYSFNDINNLKYKFSFIDEYLKNDFNFTTLKGDQKAAPLTKLEDIFTNIGFENISLENGMIFTAINANENKTNKIYYGDNHVRSLYYKIKDNEIKIYLLGIGGKIVNNKNIFKKSKSQELIFSNSYDSQKKYYIKVGSEIIAVDKPERLLSKSVSNGDKVEFFTTDNNIIINNPSFEDGLWQERVGDCNNYDDKPILAMSLNTEEKTHGKQSLQLESTRHIACTAKEFDVQEGAEYLFSFDYQGIDAKNLGYNLAFNNEEKTAIDGQIAIENNDWHAFSKKIKIPDGANSAVLYLYVYESNGEVSNISRYDNFKFNKIDFTKEITINVIKKEFNEMKIDLKSGENIITYQGDHFNNKNLINNHSFEEGMWNKDVGDCNNYDNDQSINMSINTEEKSEGKNSLQLEAKKHSACTTINIPVRENSDYFFSFDYQSPNAKQAAYNLGFDNEESDSIGEKLKIENSNWHKFDSKIRVPKGATSVNLYIYANETNREMNNIVRYDNFKLVEFSNLENNYYFVSASKEEMKNPEKVEFDLLRPTKKIIHVKSATTPFFLVMSENYHPQWQLQLNNEKVKGVLNRWWPLVQPDIINNEYHYELNGFLNAWYVDVNEICKDNSACHKNEDGFYDIEMIAEFWPQRSYYLGVLISSVALMGCFVGLIILFISSRRKKNRINKKSDINKGQKKV